MIRQTRPGPGNGWERARRGSRGYSRDDALIALCLLVASGAGLAAATPNFTLTIQEESGARLLPARVHLQDAAGHAVKAPVLPFWRDHFVCTGRVSLTLEPGVYRWEVERGPEWTSAAGSVTIDGGVGRSVTNAIRRLADLASEGWWGGETHVHRSTAEAELLMAAEDLHVTQFITWWNRANPWATNPVPASPVAALPDGRFAFLLGGEDERGGGALLYHDLPRPLDITRGQQYFPSSVVHARQARERGAVWIEAEKPFWWDFPLWVAHGLVDTVGIAHNHLHRGGVMGNEAWGRPRDMNRFPGPQGNGRWTFEIYHHLLNCGLRIPPTAGSASGVLPNPVGYNRVYVHIDDGPLTHERWSAGLRAGRSFVSNGPLLRARANGQFPGHVFRTTGGPLEVSVEARLDSRDAVATVELVQNGRVEQVSLPARFTASESGWFLLRAVADVTNTLRFASTAPWYVEIGGKPMVPRQASAQFFVDWCRERTRTLEREAGLDSDQREAVLQPWRQAEQFWQERLAKR